MRGTASPVFAYGFEDLTGAEWAAARGARGPRRGHRLAAVRARPRPRSRRCSAPRTTSRRSPPGGSRSCRRARRVRAPGARAPRARASSPIRPPRGPAIDGAVRFLEGAGARGTLELVGEEMLAPAARGTRRRRRSRSSARASTAGARRSRPRSARSGSRYAVEGEIRSRPDRRSGSALLALLRFAWLGGGRARPLRLPPLAVLGLAALDRRLRRGPAARPRGRRPRACSRRRPSGCATAAVPRARGAARRRRAGRGRPRARGLDAARRATASRRRRRPTRAALDLRAYDAIARLLDELDGWRALGGELDARGGRSPRSSAPRCGSASRRTSAGRVAVLDLMRARTRRFEARLRARPRGGQPARAAARASPFLDDDARRDARRARRAARPRPTRSSRDRYLFYTACTRATRRLDARPRGGDRRGQPARAEPVLGRGRGALRARRRARAGRARRPLSALTWPLEGAPTERERLRALAALAATSRRAPALAVANGWERRLERARDARSRAQTRARAPASCSSSSARRTTFSVTELERFADCSSAWFFERLHLAAHDRRRGRPELRGLGRAHRAAPLLRRACRRSSGRERVEPEPRRGRGALPARVPRRGARRACGMEMTDAAAPRARAEPVARPRAARPRRGRLATCRSCRAGSRSGSAPSAPRPSCSAGSTSATALTLSGKIDRIDVDPFTARGIVQDYKSGKHAPLGSGDREGAAAPDPALHARPARPRRDRAARRPLPAARRRAQARAGCCARRPKRRRCPGFAKNDYLDEDAFWAQVDEARATARAARAADPRGRRRARPEADGACPTWCDLWPMCRVRRA